MLDHQNLFNRISTDPKVCFGKPHIKKTRIKVSFILELLASSWTINDILNEYDHLTKEDITACFQYAQLHLEKEIKP